MGDIERLEEHENVSVLSSFLIKKVKDKGWSKREFAEKTGLNETYVYKLLSGKRDFTPTDDTLSKIYDVLELSQEDRKFIHDLAVRERESGNLVFPELPVPPVPPPLPEHPGGGDPSPVLGVIGFFWNLLSSLVKFICEFFKKFFQK